MQLSLPLQPGDQGDTPLSLPAPFSPPSPPVQRVYVRNRRARRYVIRVMADGSVRVTIPRGGSRKEAASFAERQHAWIGRQRARLTQPLWSVDERRRLVHRARVELPERLRALALDLQVHVTRISIRDQRTRWGSCAPDGHVSLNWRLVAMPEWVRDYVLIHELMHLRRHNHSPAYWALVAAVCPDYQRARRWLRTNGPDLR